MVAFQLLKITKLTPIACLHSTPLECKRGHFFFYRHIAPLEQRGLFTDKPSSRQRRDISIETDVKVSALQRSAICVDAGSIGVKLLYNGMLLKYLHTRLYSRKNRGK